MPRHDDAQTFNVQEKKVFDTVLAMIARIALDPALPLARLSPFSP